MTYEDVEVPYREQVMEVKQQTMQVPRMTEEMQSYTTYANQTIQEPVQVMVPQTQTVNTVQQIQKVVEYARTPVNQYVVPGPSYTMPVQQEMQYQQYQQMPTQVVQQEGLQYQQMPTQGYQMPMQQSYGYSAGAQAQYMPQQYGGMQYGMPQQYGGMQMAPAPAQQMTTT